MIHKVLGRAVGSAMAASAAMVVRKTATTHARKGGMVIGNNAANAFTRGSSIVRRWGLK